MSLEALLPPASHPGSARALLALLLLGILFDAAWLALRFRPEIFWAGPDGDLRERMFRLARVAAVALPVLALLFNRLARRAPPGRAARLGGAAMLFGAVAMPAVLAAAAFTNVKLRFFLPLPALDVFFAALSGLVLAGRGAPRLEKWGWLSITAATGAGLAMGLYAFDAPFLPHFAGAYDDFPRRLIRLAHESAIVSGMALIFLARALEKKRSRR